MLHTKKEYKKALEAAAEHAESWHRRANSNCSDEFKCHLTGYQWPANAFALSLGYRDKGDHHNIIITEDKSKIIVEELKIKRNHGDDRYIEDFVDILIEIVKKSHLNHYFDDVDEAKGKKTAKALRKFAAHL